jgi:hypothetical protein
MSEMNTPDGDAERVDPEELDDVPPGSKDVEGEGDESGASVEDEEMPA